MDNQLKPCPFCGSNNVGFYPDPDEPEDESGFIWCRGCDFSSDMFIDQERATRAWNRRAESEG